MSAPDLRRIIDVAGLIQTGELSPVDLVRACLEQIDARPEVNAFIARLDEHALADAERHADEISQGGYRGPLHGIPIAVKDLIDVAGTRTTSASAVPVEPAQTDAGVTCFSVTALLSSWRRASNRFAMNPEASHTKRMVRALVSVAAPPAGI